MNLRCNNAAAVARHQSRSKSWTLARFVHLQRPANREHVCAFLQPPSQFTGSGPGRTSLYPWPIFPSQAGRLHLAISPVPTSRQPRTRVRGLPKPLPLCPRLGVPPEPLMKQLRNNGRDPGQFGSGSAGGAVAVRLGVALTTACCSRTGALW